MPAPAAGLVVAARASALAQQQAQTAARAWQKQNGGSAQCIAVTTRGDQQTDKPLAAIGGKELFIGGVRRALTSGRANCAAHSLKDMAATQPPQFALAVGFAEDARDAAVCLAGCGLAELPRAATVGVCSPRRIALLRRHFPHLRAVFMRGNVQTRLAKMEAGACDALLLAVAGLRRLGLQGRISQILPKSLFVPAAGQGLLALECMANNKPLAAQLAALGCPAATARARAERAFVAAMEGDCHTPLAAHAQVKDGVVDLRVFFADERNFYDAQAQAPAANAEECGRRAAADIKAQIAKAGGGDK